MRAGVSVIIPCYRCAATIRRAVASVADQTLLPEEILLIDDFSDDGGATLAALEGLQREFGETVRILILRLQENGGPGTARNAGWEKANQPYLAFLDADDAWHPKKIEIQYGWMKAHPEVALSGHRSLGLDSGSAMPDVCEAPDSCSIGPKDMLVSNRFPARSVMLKRDLPFRFEPGKRYAEDYLLWLSIVLSGARTAFLSAPLAFAYKSDFGEGGLSGAMWKMEKGELDTYRRLRRRGFISFATWMGLAALSLVKFARRLALRGTTT